MKNRRMIFVMVLAVGMTVSVFGQRREADRGMRNKSQFDKEWIAKSDRGRNGFESKLTDEQKTAIKEIKLKSSKESDPLRYKMKELKAKHQTLVNADKANMKAINSNIDEMTKIENQLAKIKAKERVDVLSKLTDEQKLMYPEHKQNRGFKSRGNR